MYGGAFFRRLTNVCVAARAKQGGNMRDWTRAHVCVREREEKGDTIM